MLSSLEGSLRRALESEDLQSLLIEYSELKFLSSLMQLEQKSHMFTCLLLVSHCTVKPKVKLSSHVPRLTRVEWGVIRRTHYTELRSGSRDGLPTYLVKPLLVGQRIMAIYLKTREVHDGTVLTVDHDMCRVQFNQPRLGAEIIMVKNKIVREVMDFVKGHQLLFDQVLRQDVSDTDELAMEQMNLVVGILSKVSNNLTDYSAPAGQQQPTLSLLGFLLNSVTTALENAAEEKSLLLNKVISLLIFL
ncbi:protein ALWAYS EARLY 3 isoform X1 [Tanacetum coccineum]